MMKALPSWGVAYKKTLRCHGQPDQDNIKSTWTHGLGVDMLGESLRLSGQADNLAHAIKTVAPSKLLTIRSSYNAVCSHLPWHQRPSSGARTCHQEARSHSNAPLYRGRRRLLHRQAKAVPNERLIPYDPAGRAICDPDITSVHIPKASNQLLDASRVDFLSCVVGKGTRAHIGRVIGMDAA